MWTPPHLCASLFRGRTKEGGPCASGSFRCDPLLRLFLWGPSTPMEAACRLGSSATLHLPDLTSTLWNLSVPIYRATTLLQRLLATSHREHLAT